MYYSSLLSALFATKLFGQIQPADTKTQNIQSFDIRSDNIFAAGELTQEEFDQMKLTMTPSQVDEIKRALEELKTLKDDALDAAISEPQAETQETSDAEMTDSEFNSLIERDGDTEVDASQRGWTGRFFGGRMGWLGYRRFGRFWGYRPFRYPLWRHRRFYYYPRYPYFRFPIFRRYGPFRAYMPVCMRPGYWGGRFGRACFMVRRWA